MKKRTRKIDKIVSLAAAEERSFGVQAGRSRKYLDEQLERLGELNAFRHNYTDKNPASSGVTAAVWKDYQSFLHRLDAAVSAQQQIIRDGERNLETHRQRWLAKRQRLESLERVLEKYKDQDRAYESRLEQKSADELSNLRPSGFESTKS
jgi:flagellar FliJ protein